MKISDDLEARDLDIAVIGMELRAPGAKNVDEFWENICEGIESLTYFSDEELLAAGVPKEDIEDENYIKCGFVLDDIKSFDAPFFGFTPKEASLTDPQQRILLESAWKLLERSGYASNEYDSDIGVFVGTSMSKYLLKNIMSNYNLDTAKDIRQIWMGNDGNFASTIISYKHNLKGPSVNVQTACSTSLTAVALACQSLLNYQCDMAIAGGCSIELPHNVGYKYQSGEVLSKDGHCRPFDKNGSGTLPGSGCALVMLKRLNDAIRDSDNIICIIKGFAYNNDGNAKVGFTAPSVEGERKAIKYAQVLSEVEEDTITYVETHGTATPLGDPVEIRALAEAFREGTDKKQFCALGAVKANIGHLDCAAGTAGLIKTCLMLQHKKLVPLINFKEENPSLNLKDSPFYINTELKDWEPECGVRRAGVSSFGIGGTNVHVVLEEAVDERTFSSKKNYHLLTWSARTKTSFDRIKKQLVEFLENNKENDYRNLLYTMNVGRKKMQYRGSIVCDSKDELISKLKESMFYCKTDKDKEDNIVFMFPGQGSQYINMARELYDQYPFYKMTMDECLSLLKVNYNYDLSKLLFSNNPEEYADLIHETEHAHISLFVVEYCMAKLLMHYGITPKVILGHSIGEYAGACIAGVFSLEDALRIVVTRGKIIQSLPKGRMLYVNASEEEVQEYLGPQVSLALVNTDKRVVLSGEEKAIQEVIDKIGNRFKCKLLHTSHAFHSHMLRAATDPFRNLLTSIKMNEPNIRFLSNVTGGFVKEELTTVDYWVHHMLDKVRFRDEVAALEKEDYHCFIIAGPGKTLSIFLKEILYDNENIVILNTIRDQDNKISDRRFFEEFLGKAWMNGINFKWKAYYEGEKLYRISAPTYPFDLKELWIDAKNSKVQVENEEPQFADEVDVTDEKYNRPDLSCKYEAPTNAVEESLVAILEELMGIHPIGIDDNFFELGGHSLLATQFISRIKDTFEIELQIKQIMEAATVRQISEQIIDMLSEYLENEDAISKDGTYANKG
jgi:phthiocerol/phenolphthiocerol synthesis type-I polyketide synthase E